MEVIGGKLLDRYTQKEGIEFVFALSLLPLLAVR